MKLETLNETKYKELMAFINPLIDFMTANDYSFFLVAGKNGTCTRQLGGNYDDVHGMITGMMQSQKQVGAMLSDIVNDFKPLKNDTKRKS